MKNVILSLMIIASPFGSAAEASHASQKVVCSGEATDGWVKKARATDEKSRLFKLAIAQFGPLVGCSGHFTPDDNGQRFGSMSYQFNTSATMTVEFIPPETSIFQLEAKNGFVAEKEAIETLKRITSETGLKVDWSKAPDIEKSKGQETHTYWDPDPGTNGRGFLVYGGKKLIAIGYGMAL